MGSVVDRKRIRTAQRSLGLRRLHEGERGFCHLEGTLLGGLRTPQTTSTNEQRVNTPAGRI